jgi:putative transposase
VEATGGPLGATIAGANVHDTKLLAATLEAIVVERPHPTVEQPQHLCLDKGYDNPTGHETVAAYQYTPHIRRIGEERLDAYGKNAIRRGAGWWNGHWRGSPNVGASWCGTRRKLAII